MSWRNIQHLQTFQHENMRYSPPCRLRSTADGTGRQVHATGAEENEREQARVHAMFSEPSSMSSAARRARPMVKSNS